MSREVFAAVIRGAHGFVQEAEAGLAQAIEAKGEDGKVEFPETAFYLPMIYALLGLEIKTPKYTVHEVALEYDPIHKLAVLLWPPSFERDIRPHLFRLDVAKLR